MSPENEAVHIPETDLSRPLKEYLISSSHNTYLVGHQLYGDASIEGYKTVLTKGCRCIEVDCWDGDNGEPKVVHGYESLLPLSSAAFTPTSLPFLPIGLGSVSKANFEQLHGG